MWDRAKIQELISIFENNCIGNSLQYVTNNLHFLQLLIILHQMPKKNILYQLSLNHISIEHAV